MKESHLGIIVILMLSLSCSVYAKCYESANYYTSKQSVFGYASQQGHNWLLLDSANRLYEAEFLNKIMTLERKDALEAFSNFDSKNTLSYGTIRDIEKSRYQKRKHDVAKLGGDISSRDIIFDLSTNMAQMTILAGFFPQYVLLIENTGKYPLNWKMMGDTQFILGVHSNDSVFLALVVIDNNIQLLRSVDGYIWEKSNFKPKGFVRAYTFNNQFWLADDRGNQYLSMDGLKWQKSEGNLKFSQYIQNYETYYAEMVSALFSENYVINAMSGDHHGGVIIGSCTEVIDSEIQKVGFLLHNKDGQHTMYTGFNNAEQLTFNGEPWPVEPSK